MVVNKIGADHKVVAGGEGKIAIAEHVEAKQQKTRAAALRHDRAKGGGGGGGLGDGFGRRRPDPADTALECQLQPGHRDHQ